jgi:hypothetical protein
LWRLPDLLEELLREQRDVGLLETDSLERVDDSAG